jgi:uncharacterized membrane protein YqiK
VFGLPSNIGEWLQAMRELHRRQTEATERLAAAAERIAGALEGRRENGKAEALAGERDAFRIVAEAYGKHRRG